MTGDEFIAEAKRIGYRVVSYEFGYDEYKDRSFLRADLSNDTHVLVKENGAHMDDTVHSACFSAALLAMKETKAGKPLATGDAAMALANF